jgi:hypothetical protein
MDERDAVLAELHETRERAVGLLRAKLDAAASQIREAAARSVGELDLIIPPDLEALLPLAPFHHRLAELEQTLIEAARPEVEPAPPVATVPSFDLAGLRRLDAGRAQSEVLQELLRQVEPFCAERAIVVFREGQVAGWAGAGFAAGDPVRGWRGSLAGSPALSRVAAGVPVLAHAAIDPVLTGWLGDGRRALAVPMSLRGKIVGALLAVAGEGAFAPEMVQLLTYATGLMLETLQVRPTVPTAALLDAEVMEPAPVVAPPEPAAAEDVAFAMPAEEEPAPAPEITVPPGTMWPVVDSGATVQLKVPVAPVMPARTPDEERKHEEAKRFARLLVSEIRLYNEQAVIEGRQTRDIYRRLKEDIDRSREMFEQRVPAEVRAQSNYFSDELVRILADGDTDALGL